MAEITESMIEQKLINQLQACHVVVKDNSVGCGQSFHVITVSEMFVGQTLLERHRLVNECLTKEIAQIHAFTQKTYTPEQWAKTQSTS